METSGIIVWFGIKERDHASLLIHRPYEKRLLDHELRIEVSAPVARNPVTRLSCFCSSSEDWIYCATSSLVGTEPNSSRYSACSSVENSCPNVLDHELRIEVSAPVARNPVTRLSCFCSSSEDWIYCATSSLVGTEPNSSRYSACSSVENSCPNAWR